MREQVKVTGIVLSAISLGENDRRITILTKERGKISVFARGCKKPRHPLFGVAQPLVAGEFMITEGRNSAYLNSGEGTDFFPALKSDLDRICYATYFAELAEYFTVEGMDERNTLNLLFVTFKAVEKQQIPLPLIRRIYEVSILQFYGIGMQVFSCVSCGKEEELFYFSPESGGMICADCRKKGKRGAARLIRVSPAVIHALRYIASAPIGRLYSFLLDEAVLDELSRIVTSFMRLHVEHRFRSEKMLDS